MSVDANVSPELVDAIDDVFLGWWPDDLVVIFTADYVPGALAEYAHRDGGQHIDRLAADPHEQSETGWRQ